MLSLHNTVHMLCVVMLLCIFYVSVYLFYSNNVKGKEWEKYFGVVVGT